MPAIILRHSRAPEPTFDPPSTLPQYEPPTEEDMERLDMLNALERLMDVFGARRVAIAARVLADIHEPDRPLDRCLADGSRLPASRICVQCGRDNR